jgi:hypothetical protein
MSSLHENDKFSLFPGVKHIKIFKSQITNFNGNVDRFRAVGNFSLNIKLSSLQICK